VSQSTTLVLDHPVRRRPAGFLERHPFRTGTEILKYVDPIRKHARKTARKSFVGGEIVAAATRVENTGKLGKYRPSRTAREFARIDDCEELVAVLASRVGNPHIAPNPPLWPLLALVLLEWQSTLSPAGVLARAASMEQGEQAVRGLVITAYLFPELESWLAEVQFGIPFWERIVAVPLAARKLVLLDKTV